MSAVDEDVDMDAPQISTLREEDTPPPTRTSKRVVKLLVVDKKGKGKSSSPSIALATRKNAQNGPTPVHSDEEVEEEEEEDQLIDDDELPTSTAPVPGTSSGTKRKAPTKKTRPRKMEKQDKEPDKPLPGYQERAAELDEPSAPSTAVHEKLTPKKKAPPRKAAVSKSKGKTTKTPATLIVPSTDDAAMSETHTITAPSSPFLHDAHEGGQSPDVEEPQQPQPPSPEGLVDTQPLPVYPLPSKPFPVQPPPKISTGFAPMLPLDRTGTKVRRWRVANREIRGIAGGRWFTRAWVGDKDSEFAAAVTLVSGKLVDGDKISIPKSATSAPALGKAGKAKAPRASAGISSAPSRADSIVSEMHPTKAPTKMRNVVVGPASEAGNESDAATAPEPPANLMEP
ncbi:hypothetical protein SCLCIDRAFT_19058 [Scleroderma citrinum Foug A]|uniref:Uncharacterized protein n=1 Tax=Scleroderma citrinum Foug A TaxID=1036808 RepID=A0A0C3A8U1_9AGAM|nr:hypothetical protein SCLCIDRAFT_19058 [Scleroderma citrinum Foug A]